MHLIVDAVALMDLKGFEASCKVGKAGQAPFAPRVLLALLISAYGHGVRSSRVIERLWGCVEGAGLGALRILAGKAKGAQWIEQRHRVAARR